MSTTDSPAAQGAPSYLPSEAKIVPAGAVLGAKTVAVVKLPNRTGFVPNHRPDKFRPAAKVPHQSKALPAAASK